MGKTTRKQDACMWESCETGSKAVMKCPDCGRGFCDLCALAGGIAEAEASGRQLRKVRGHVEIQGCCPYCGTILKPLRTKTGTTQKKSSGRKKQISKSQSKKKWWQFWKKEPFQPRTDIKYKCKKSSPFGNRKFLRTGEIDCRICGLKQLALPSKLPLEQALAQRDIGTSGGPFAIGSSPRSAIPLYCTRCGNVICRECMEERKLNELCPDCGKHLKYLTHTRRA